MYIFLDQVVRFNRSKVPPDVFRDDMVSSATDFRHNSYDQKAKLASILVTICYLIICRCISRLSQMEEEVFQRQADLIQYFKDRNVILQKTVLHLHNRANAIQAQPS